MKWLSLVITACFFLSPAFAAGSCTYTVEEVVKNNYFGSHEKVIVAVNKRVFEALSKKGYRFCHPGKKSCSGSNQLFLKGGYGLIKNGGTLDGFGYQLTLQEGTEAMWTPMGGGKIRNENFKGQNFLGASQQTIVPITIGLEETAAARLLVDIKDHALQCTY